MTSKEFSIRGFVKNEGTRAPFTLQRSIPPEAEITFADAYKVVGEKSGKEGREFVAWLREKVLAGPTWGFYKDEGVPFFSETASANQDPAPEAPAPPSKEAKGAGKNLRRQQTHEVKKGVEITPRTIVEAEPIQAKALIAECSDKAVLKKAMALARNLAGRGDHVRHLMRRLEQVS